MDNQQYYSHPNHQQAPFPQQGGYEREAPKIWTPPSAQSNHTQQPLHQQPYNPMNQNQSMNQSMYPPHDQYASPVPQQSVDMSLRNRAQPAQSPGGRPPVDQAAYLPQQLMSNPLAAAAFNAYGAQVTKQMSGLFSFLNLHRLKYYFHVNNRYVMNKLYILLLPFLHKNWKRERVDGMDSDSTAGYPQMVPGADISVHGHGLTFKPPSEDINAPDLYIPCMAFFTYIILVSFTVASTNLNRSFDPETIGVLTSTTLFALIFELAIAKLGLWLINTDSNATPHILDLTAYLSYKYVHAIAILSIASVFDWSWLYYGCVVLFGALQALFIMRTMNRAMKPSVDSALQGGTGLKGNYLLLALGALQIAVIAFLCKSAA